MKHIIGRLTAVSAAAITAFSMVTAAGMTAEAFPMTANIQNCVDIDDEAWQKFLESMGTNPNALNSAFGSVSHIVNSAVYQNLYPCFDKSVLPRQPGSEYPITITPGLKKDPITGKKTKSTSYGTNLTYCCTFDKTAAKLSNLSRAVSNFDKIKVKTVKNGKTENYGLLIEYVKDGTPNQFAGRLLNDYYMQNYYLNKLYLDSYNYDESTGKYWGTFILKDYYVAGLELSNNDKITFFNQPTLIADGTDGFHTEIYFSGQVRYPDTKQLFFGTGEEDAPYQVLNNIKISYNYGHSTSSVVTNKFAQKIAKSEMNNTYKGLLDGNSLITSLVYDSDVRNFHNNNFIGVTVSGKNLYICVGKNVSLDSEWKSSQGDRKLDVLLRNGYGYSFKQNTWLTNWLKNHNSTDYRVYFKENATTTSTGTRFHDCSAVTFKNKLGI